MNLLVSPVRPGGARHVGAVQGGPGVGGRAAVHRIDIKDTIDIKLKICIYHRYYRYHKYHIYHIYHRYYKYHRNHIKIIYLRM